MLNPVITKVHNQTKASFSILVQNKHEWVAPHGTTELGYDLFSACTEKERYNVCQLLESGIITVDLFMLRTNGEYESCGTYAVLKKAAQKQTVPVQPSVRKEQRTLLDGSMGVKKVSEAPEEDKPFTGKKVEEEPSKALDPMKVKEEQGAVSTAPAEEAEVEDSSSASEAPKTKKRTRKAN